MKFDYEAWRMFGPMGSAAPRLLTLAIVLVASNACVSTGATQTALRGKVCDINVLESIYTRPGFGAKRAGHVPDLQRKLERYLLEYQACNHNFSYEYFIDTNYTGPAPGLVVAVSVDYSNITEPSGCVISSFSKYCFNTNGVLELISDQDEAQR